MSVAPVAGVKEEILAVLREAFEGPAQAWSYFTDNTSDAGIFGTIEKTSARQASTATGGTTIAAHVHHVTFGLEASAASIRGERSPRDWNESWRVCGVDETVWKEIRENLRRAYERLRAAIEQHGTSGVEAVGAAIGAVAHAAYHLGAIRQKAAVARARDTR